MPFFFGIIGLIQLLQLIAIATTQCLEEAREVRKSCGSFYPYIDAFICAKKWEAITRVLSENFDLCTQEHQLYSVRID